MKFFLKFSLVFMLIFFAAGCEKEVEDVDHKKIVTTTPPLYSLTANLVEGSRIQVENLLEARVTIHDFQLKASHMALLNDADLIVVNGVGLEDFLTEVFDNYSGKVVNTALGLEVLEYEGDEHGHGVGNPHIWLSPKNAIRQSENILMALIKIDSNNEELFRKNFSVLKNKLLQLDDDLREGLGEIDIKPYIVFHDAYAYLEKDYNIKSSGVLEEFPGKEPSASYLKELIDIIEKEKIEVIFTEPQFSSKLVETLADDYGLRVFELDPLGKTISKNGYFDMMYSNLEVFKTAYEKVN